MRTMYDSINVNTLPAGADIYAGYDDGNWPDAAAIAAKFGGTPVIRITVFPYDNEGDMLDVENGDATPDQAPAWVARRRTAGHGGPLVYCSESAWSTVRAAFQAQGIPEPGYVIAAYPGSVGASGMYPPPAVGHQWIDRGPYDESVMVDYLPGIDPAPVTPPPITQIQKPLTGKIGNMNAPVVAILHTSTGNGYTIVGADGGTFNYGDAKFIGSMGGQPLSAPIVDAAFSPSGNGLYMVATDGGVFCFGDAQFHGSMGGKQLNAPVVSITVTPDDKGYWLTGADGGVFCFGDAGFHGSPA